MEIACGIHAVLEAIRSGASRVERVCVQRGIANARIQEVIDLARAHGIPLSFEERAWLDRRAGGERHQGVVCSLASVPAATAEEILGRAPAPGLVIVLDGVEDPHNLGAILRSAEVAGAAGVFLPQRRSAGLGAAAMKASAGAAAHIPVARVPNIARLIETLKERGYWVVGLDAGAKLKLWEADLAAPTALVLGGEESGLHRLVREKCDLLASIPVRGRVASHNVGVAAGIALYEAVRQRSK